MNRSSIGMQLLFVLVQVLTCGCMSRERPIRDNAQSRQVPNVPMYLEPYFRFAVRLSPNPATPPGFVPTTLSITNQSATHLRVGYTVGAERILYLSAGPPARFRVKSIGDDQCGLDPAVLAHQCRGGNGILCSQIYPVMLIRCE